MFHKRFDNNESDFWLWTRPYENTPIQILKISPPKNEIFQIKILIFFIYLLKTEIVGTR